jgi:UDP-N-acetylglucosamine--N-acetylmuramyl-(pentapeptide) pyrophosphoryl-undecaprenol N-acetylglucosamine transferase
MVMGGSQGAKAINNNIIQCLKKLFENHDIQIIHQSGQKNYEEAIEELKKFYPEYKDNQKYILEPYFDKLYLPLTAADIVVSRAGSLSISEICAAGAAALLIPYPYAASDHQRENAKEMENINAAVYLDENECTTEIFYEKLESIINNNDLLIKLQQHAQNQAKPDAVKNIAEQIKAASK